MRRLPQRCVVSVCRQVTYGYSYHRAADTCLRLIYLPVLISEYELNRRGASVHCARWHRAPAGSTIFQKISRGIG